MLNRLDLRGVTGDLQARLPRPELAGEAPVAAVRAIIADVRDRGDDALRELSLRFDGVVPEPLRVAPDDLSRARRDLNPELRGALESAHASILDFHESQVTAEADYRRGGLRVRDLRRPVDRAGLYVPGGRAVYPSTVLMTAVPARVAGVAEIALCVPPGEGGRVPAVTLAAAAIAGVDEVYAVGGAQAIAAMAYGTESILPVDVIVGPGNVYVSVAKREVAGVVGVPSAFAGPSEIVVIADDTTPATFAAIDLIVQAEHGPGGLAWLITWSPDAVERITREVDRLVGEAPRRDEITATFAQGGYAVLVDSPDQALEVANLIAPEHLQLMSADPDALVPLVRHAGAVFTGPLAPASIGDYVAGPSHVLPTDGSARFSGALTIDDFQKHVHVISLDASAFAEAAPVVEALAMAEGLDAHAASVRLRGGWSP